MFLSKPRMVSFHAARTGDASIISPDVSTCFLRPNFMGAASAFLLILLGVYFNAIRFDKYISPVNASGLG